MDSGTCQDRFGEFENGPGANQNPGTVFSYRPAFSVRIFSEMSATRLSLDLISSGVNSSFQTSSHDGPADLASPAMLS